MRPGLPPNDLYTRSGETPASVAIEAIVVVPYPSRRNRCSAASSRRSRLRRACSRRRVLSYARLGSASRCPLRHRFGSSILEANNPNVTGASSVPADLRRCGMDGPRALVDRLVRATNAHDVDAVAACFAEDYENETPVHPARGFRGREQVRKNWEQIFAGRARRPRRRRRPCHRR